MKRSVSLVLLALSLTAADAATFTVTNLNDSGVGSLRSAIAQANSTPGTNTVNFAVTGTIVLTTGMIDILNALNIVGPGQSQLTIDGNANGRIFRTLSVNANCPAPAGSSDFLVSISGLTLRNGFLPNGFNGGAINARTSLTLDSVTIRDNVAQWGGGVVFFTQYAGQTLTITDSQFINNVAKPNLANNGSGNYRGGGALSATDNCGARTASSMTITGSTFSGNRLISDPSPNVHAQGGAIALDFAGPVLIEDTRMVDNHADSNPLNLDIGLNGGAISAYAASLTVRRSEIAQNSADFVGGITALNEDPSLQTAGAAMQFLVVDSTVSGNVANQTFAGIGVAGSVAANVSNSTVAANVASTLNEGPPVTGIAVGTTDPSQRLPTLQVVSSIVAGARSSSADIFAFDVPVPFLVTASHSLLQVVDPSITLVGTGNLTGADPLLGPLAFNGGPSRTQAPGRGSPVLNFGSNPMSLATDQRGVGYPRRIGGGTDIGAYESNLIALGKTDFNADGKADILWASAIGGNWIFLMNGAVVVNGLPAPPVAPGWVLAGIGDFNGDGRADLLWSNSADPTQYWVFLMNGNAIIGGGPLTVAAGYVPTQIGDFNGDGNADIVWENASGARWIFLMNGASVIGGVPVPAAAPGWVIAGVGDFNGDGKADILWNNSASPTQYWIYLLNGDSVIGGGGFMVAAGYTPTQIADFDGDGKADILWENGTAARWIFFMNGAAITSGQPAPSAAPGWSIVGTGDLNGDSRADLLWQNGAAPTQYWIYLLNGTSVIGGGGLVVAPGYSPLVH